MTKNIRIIYAAGSILFGCGSIQNSGPGPKAPPGPSSNNREPTNLFYDNEANNLELADPNCSDELAVSDIGNVEVWQWTGQKVVKVAQDFSGVSGQGLGSEFQKTATYGYHEVEHYECEGGCTADPYDRVVVKAASTLHICSQGLDVKRDSIESASLSMYAGAKAAFQFYRSLENSSNQIQPLSFNVLPIYESIYHHAETRNKKIQNRSHTSTDNAYWKLDKSANSIIRQTIEVLPHSKEIGSLSLTGEDVRFWEISMVLGHEFGHHVFFTHAPNLVVVASAKFIGDELWSETSVRTGSPQKFDSRHLSVLSDFSGKNADLAVNVMPILESFADLFGQYSQEQEQPFKNIRCLGVNRDLAVDHFADDAQTPKILTSKSVALYSVSSGHDSFEDCNSPSVGSYYSVASVFAYGINALLDADAERFAERGGARKEKGTILLTWIEALNDELSNFDRNNIKSYLSYAIDRLVTASIGGRIPSKHYCEILQRVFPFYLENIPADSQVKLGACKALPPYGNPVALGQNS